jgi:hypothetical protein
VARPNKSRISKLTTDINNKKSEHKCSDFVVVPPGIEPGTQGFSVLCSTN